MEAPGIAVAEGMRKGILSQREREGYENRYPTDDPADRALEIALRRRPLGMHDHIPGGSTPEEWPN